MLSNNDPGDKGGVSTGSCATGVWLKEKLGRGGGPERGIPILKSMFRSLAPGSAFADFGRRPFARGNPDTADGGERAGKTKGGFGSGASVLIFDAGEASFKRAEDASSV